LEKEFRPIVSQHTLPADMMPLQRGSLEKTREEAGSQTVFVAFVLDAANKSLSLFTVGDAVAVVYGATDNHRAGISRLIPTEPSGRWSSSGNTKLRLTVVSESNVEGVTIKSDGARDWGEQPNEQERNRHAFRESAGEWAVHDDVSFVSAVLNGADANPGLREKQRRKGTVISANTKRPGDKNPLNSQKTLTSLPEVATVKSVPSGPLAWALLSVAIAVVILSGTVAFQTLTLKSIYTVDGYTQRIKQVIASGPASEPPKNRMQPNAPLAPAPPRSLDPLLEPSVDDFLPKNVSRKVVCACVAPATKTDPRNRARPQNQPVAPAARAVGTVQSSDTQAKAAPASKP
jgi:hypothetical protein